METFSGLVSKFKSKLERRRYYKHKVSLGLRRNVVSSGQSTTNDCVLTVGVSEPPDSVSLAPVVHVSSYYNFKESYYHHSNKFGILCFCQASPSQLSAGQ